MELDELKRAWAATDLRQDGMEALLRMDFHDRRLDRTRLALRPLFWGQILQIVVGVALSIWAGAFWTAHLQPLHLLVCGLLVHAYGLLLIILAARNIHLIRRIDYAAPVLEIQRRIAELRAFRVRVETPVGVVLGCFAWILVLWMALAWYGFDLWSAGFIPWAILSGVVGLIAFVLVVWAVRWMGYGHKLDDESAGRSVVRAQAVLDELARFERE